MLKLPMLKAALLFLALLVLTAMTPQTTYAALAIKSAKPKAEKTEAAPAASTNAVPSADGTAKPKPAAAGNSSQTKSSTPSAAATPPAAASGAGKPGSYVSPSASTANKTTASAKRTVSTQDSIGTVTRIEGQVDILPKGSSAVIELFEGDALVVGDIIRTKTNSKAELTFSDGSVIRLAEKSRFQISGFQFNDKKREGTFNLSRGKIKAFVNKSSDTIRKVGFSGSPKFEVHTPTAVVGVKGTIFFVFYVNGVSGVYTEEGLVKSYNKAFPNKPVDVGAGKYVLIKGDSAPSKAENYTTSAVTNLEEQTSFNEDGSEASNEDTSGTDTLSDTNDFSITGNSETPNEKTLIQQSPFMGWSGALMAMFLDGPGGGQLKSPTGQSTFTFYGMMGDTFNAALSNSDYTNQGTYWQGAVSGTEYYGSAFDGYIGGSWLQATSKWESSVAMLTNGPEGPGIILGYIGGSFNTTDATFSGTGILAGGLTGGTLLPCTSCDALTTLQGSLGTAAQPSISITNSINAMPGQLSYTSTGNKKYLIFTTGPATWGITQNTFTGSYTTPGAGTYSTTLGGSTANGYSLASATLTDDGTSGIRLNMVGTYIDPLTIETFSTNNMGAYNGTTLTGAGTGSYSTTSLAFSTAYNGAYIYGDALGALNGSTARNAIIGSAGDPFQTLNTNVSAYMLGTAVPAGEITWTSAVSGSNFTGWMQGTTATNGSASSLLKAIYVDGAGNAGILNGTFSGSYYALAGMTEQTGTLTATTPKITGYAGSTTPTISASTGAANGTFTGPTGSISLLTSTQTASLTGQSWGIFNTTAGGAYLNPSSATGLTYSSGGSGWQGATGYWIANTTGTLTLSATSKTISGSLSGTYMTLTDMGTITGSMTGSYNTVNAGYMETTTLGEYSSTNTLTLSGAITSTGANFFGSSVIPWSGNMQGILGSTTSGGLFASPTFTILGTYANPDAYSVYSSRISGSDVATGAKFIGNNIGMVSGTSVNGLVVGIYINPLTNTTGIVKSTNVTGSLYPSFGMWEANGSFSTTLKGTTTVPVASLAWGNPAIVVASPSGTVTGNITGVISTQRTSLSDQNWGLSLSAISGVYGGTPPDSFTATSGAVDSPVSPTEYTLSSLLGSVDAAGKVAGTLTGTTLTATSKIQATETVYGQVTFGKISAVGSGEFTSTPLTVSIQVLKDPAGNMLALNGLQSGTMQGIIGSTTTGGLFASPSFTTIGAYTNPNNSLVYGSQIAGTDTSGAQLVGVSVGTLFNGSINGGILGIYVKPTTGEAGFVRSTSVTGTLYPTYGMWEANIALSTSIEAPSSAIQPTNVFWGAGSSVIDDWSSGSASGNVTGSFITDRVYLTGLNWGIATSKIFGTYSGPATGTFTAKGGANGLDVFSKPTYTIADISGSIDGAGKVTGTGTVTSTTLTTSALITSTEDIYGAMSGGSLAANTLGEFTSTPLSVSIDMTSNSRTFDLSILNNLFVDATGSWFGRFDSLIGSTDPNGIFGGGSPTLVAIGNYENTSIKPMYKTVFQGTDTTTVYPGNPTGFVGINVGNATATLISGEMPAIYIDNNGAAGIIAITNVTGTPYAGLQAWESTNLGTISYVQKAPSTIYANTDAVLNSPVILGAMSHTDISGAITGTITTQRYYITGEKWGLATSELFGTCTTSCGSFSLNSNATEYDQSPTPVAIGTSMTNISVSVAAGIATGTVQRTITTATELITTTETLYGAISGTNIGFVTTGTFTSSVPLGFSASLNGNYIYGSSGTLLQGAAANNVSLSSTSTPFGAPTPVAANLTGTASPLPTGEITWASRVTSLNNINSSEKIDGWAAGITVASDGTARSIVKTLYVDSSSNIGILTGIFNTGVYTPGTGITTLTGTMSGTSYASGYNVSTFTPTVYTIGASAGDPDFTNLTSTLQTMWMPNNPWGIFNANFAGTYAAAPAPTFTFTTGGTLWQSIADSHWLMNASNNWNANQTIDGTLTGTYLTPTEFGTVTGSLLGSYDTFAGAPNVEAVALGEFTGTPLQYSTNFNLDALKQIGASVAPFMVDYTSGAGGLATPWLTGSSDFTALGTYAVPAGNYVLYGGVGSWNPATTTYTTYDGGTFEILTIGLWTNTGLTLYGAGMYIDPSQNIGFASLNATGTQYTGASMWDMNGTITTTEKAPTTGLAPANMITIYDYWTNTLNPGQISGPTFSGSTNWTQTLSITDASTATAQTWGVYRQAIGGTVDPLYTTFTSTMGMSLSIGAYYDSLGAPHNDNGYWISTIAGTLNATDGTLTAANTGNFLTLTKMGTLSGNVYGLYDATLGTWGAVDIGMWDGTPLQYSANIFGVRKDLNTVTGGLTLTSNPIALGGGVLSPWNNGGTTNLIVIGDNTGGTASPNLFDITFVTNDPVAATPTTYDGGAFTGRIVGFWDTAGITGSAVGLYIDPSGNAGLIAGSVTGNYYQPIDMWDANGALTTTQLAALTGLQAQNITNYIYSTNTSLIPLTGTFGDLASISATHSIETKSFADFINHVAYHWGTYADTINGTFNTATTSTTFTSHSGSFDTWGGYYDISGGLNPDTTRWVMETTGNNWSNGSFDGTQTGSYISRTNMGTITGTVTGLYDTTSGFWSGIGTGTWEGTDLAYSGNMNGGCWQLSPAGSLSATRGVNSIFGGLTAPWSTPSNFELIGSYWNGIDPMILDCGFATYNVYDSTPTALIGGGAFKGKVNGLWTSAGITGKAIGLYIDPSSNIGFVNGNLTGSTYFDTNNWTGQGTLNTTLKSASLLNAADITTSIYTTTSSPSNAFGGEFTDTRYIYGTSTLKTDSFVDITNITIYHWGVYDQSITGTYNNTSPTSNTFSSAMGGYAMMGYRNFDITNQPIEDDGYWISALSGTFNADGTITGTNTGNFLTLTKMGTLSGNVYGLYDATLGTWGAIDLGTWETTDLFAFSKNFIASYYHNSNGMNSFFGDEVNAIIGTTANPFSSAITPLIPGAPANAYMMGSAMPTGGQISWVGSINGQSSVNPADYSQGWLGGITAYDGTATTFLKNIYVDANGNAGILSGFLSGTNYPLSLGMTDQAGSLTATRMNAVVYSPVLPEMLSYSSTYFNNGIGVFNSPAIGDFLSVDNTTLNTMNIGGEPWGIFQISVDGLFANTTPSSLFDFGLTGDQWTGSLGYWMVAGTENWNANQTIGGTLNGKYITPLELGTLTADLFGSYDIEPFSGQYEVFAIGEYSGTPLAFSLPINGTYWSNCDDLCNSGNMKVILGSEFNPFDSPNTPGMPVVSLTPAVMMGLAQPTAYNAIMWTALIDDVNYIDIDEHMSGYAGGLTTWTTPGPSITLLKTVYVDTITGDAGILSGTNLTGTFDSFLGWTDQSGQLWATRYSTGSYIGTMPTVIVNGIWGSGSGFGLFDNNGNDYIKEWGVDMFTTHITNEPWGVFNIHLAGAYNNPNSSSTFAMALGGNIPSSTGYWLISGDNFWNPDQTISGAMGGLYITPDSLGTLAGNILGSYDTAGLGAYEAVVIGEYTEIPLMSYATIAPALIKDTQRIYDRYITYTDGGTFSYTYNPCLGEIQINEIIPGGTNTLTTYYPDGSTHVQTVDNTTSSILTDVWTNNAWDPATSEATIFATLLTPPDRTPMASINNVTDTSYFGTYNTGTIYGQLGTVDSLWSGTNITVTSVGAFQPGVLPPSSIWFGTQIYSSDYTTSTATTYDGGAFYGMIGGSDYLNAAGTLTLDGRFVALYIEPTNNDAGTLSGVLTGTAYPNINMYELSGPVNRTPVALGTGVLPVNLGLFLSTGNMSFSGIGASSGGTPFLDSSRNGGYGLTQWLDIPGYSLFGIFGTTFGGFVDTPASSWTAEVGGSGGFGPDQGWWLGFINDGTTGIDGNMLGTITNGHYLTATHMGTLEGNFYGTLNKFGHPYFEGIALGTWQDTTELSFYGKGAVDFYLGSQGVEGGYYYIPDNGTYHYEYHNDASTYNNIATAEYYRAYGATHTYTIYYPNGTTRTYNFNTDTWITGTWDTTKPLATVVSTPPDNTYDTITNPPWSAAVLNMGLPAGYSEFNLGGANSLWTGTSTPVSIIGSFNTGVTGIDGPYIFGPGWPQDAFITSWNAIANNYTTYDGGAFKGLTLGTMNKSYGLKAMFYGLYMDATGKIGILKSNDITGDAYAGANIQTMNGTITRAEMTGTTGILQSDFVPLRVMTYLGDIKYLFSGNAGGASPIDIELYIDSIDQNITGDFGVFMGGSTGICAAAATGPWSMSTYYNGVGIGNIQITNMEMSGATWTGGDISGTLLGVNVDATGTTPSVAIISGDVLGIYDPAAPSTFDMVVAGSYMTVTRFLEMAGKIPGTINTAALDTLNIPYVEVGKTNLSGTNITYGLNVNMNNVIFFAYSTDPTNTPKMWATGSIQGNYTAIPTPGTSVNLTGTDGLSAQFNIEHFDTTKWLAMVNGSGTYTGTGSMSAPPSSIVFDGAATGIVDDPTKTFGGSGAGLVHPAAP